MDKFSNNDFTTDCADLKLTELTNGGAANSAPEVAFSFDVAF